MLLTVGLVLMVVGYALTFIGVTIYESNIRNPSHAWWEYAIIIGGITLVVIGSMITIVRFGTESSTPINY